jgi:hypothetical protein
MDAAAALLNDTEKQVFTYVAQLPYLKIALKELREWMELSNAPVTNKTSAVITVPIGTTVVGFATSPALPSDLVEIQEVWERKSSDSSFIPMVRREFLSHVLDGETVTQFQIWAWKNNTIELPEASVAIELKLDYIQNLFTNIIDQNSKISVVNCESFLSFRTASLCAEFIGENESRAQKLDAHAQAALERREGIDSKGKQQIATRHRPFRASFKSRGLC